MQLEDVLGRADAVPEHGRFAGSLAIGNPADHGDSTTRRMPGPSWTWVASSRRTISALSSAGVARHVARSRTCWTAHGVAPRALRAQPSFGDDAEIAAPTRGASVRWLPRLRRCSGCWRNSRSSWSRRHWDFRVATNSSTSPMRDWRQDGCGAWAASRPWLFEAVPFPGLPQRSSINRILTIAGAPCKLGVVPGRHSLRRDEIGELEPLKRRTTTRYACACEALSNESAARSKISP